MICTKKFFFGVILDRNGSNGVGVKDVEDNNIRVATVGCDRETACLIGEEVAIDFVDGHENKVCAGAVGFLSNILHVVIKAVRNLTWYGCWSGVSRLDSLALLIHVSHF